MSKQASSGNQLKVTAAVAPPVAAAFAASSTSAVAGGCCGGGGCGAEPKKDGTAAAVAKSTGLLVDLGNTKCPVMGGKPDGKTWSEWNGLRIGHCCPGCRAKFGADAEKYLAGAKIDWKPAAAAAKAVDVAKGADRVKALAALKAKWTVLREPAPEASPAKTEQPKKDDPKPKERSK